MEERRGVCELVQQENARDILVVGTNAVWLANVARAMESCGISVQRLAAGGGLGGVARSLDFCDANRNARAMSGAIERLACDENDSIAWRTWCSFGDALARNASVERLRRAVAPYGLSFAEALRRLEAGELEGVCPDEPLLACASIKPTCKHCRGARRARASVWCSRVLPAVVWKWESA